MPEPVARADGGAPIAAGPSTTVATRAVSPLWHVGALCVLDGPIGETELVERVASGSRSLPGLHPEPGERGRRSPFDPREHVGTAALSPPGRHRDLSSALSEIWSRRLDPRRPLFQVILVQGLAGGESAVVVKAHRDLVDPCGGIEFASRLLGEESPVASRVLPSGRRGRSGGPGHPGAEAVRLGSRGGSTPPGPHRMPPSAAAWPAPRPDPPGPRSLLAAAGGIAGALAEPWIERSRDLGRGLLELLEPGVAMGRARDLARQIEATSLVVSTPAPEAPINGPLGPARHLGFVRLSSEVLSAVAELGDAEVDEVLLAIVADAVGRHLEARGRPTAGLDLIAITRLGRGGDPLDTGRDALLPMPVGALAPPARRAAIRAALRDPSNRSRLESLDALVQMSRSLPAPLRDGAGSLACQAANVVCVRARAAVRDIDPGGRRVRLLVPITPLPWNVGLGFAWSDAGGGETIVGINGDAGLIPDIGALEAALRAAYVEAAAAAGVPAIDPERTPGS